MNDPPVSPHSPNKIGCALAIAIGVLVVFVVNGLDSLFFGSTKSFPDDWGIFLFELLVVVVPFGFLSLGGIKRKAPWIVGLALTATLWSYYLYDSSLDRGVNFLLGPLLLLSPIGISIACFAVDNGLGKRS